MNLPVIYEALGHLAARQPAIREQVVPVLRSALPAHDGLAATMRLIVAGVVYDLEQNEEGFPIHLHTRDLSENIVVFIMKSALDLEHSFSALLDAGEDDDVWDGYHSILVLTARGLIEQATEQASHLLRVLINRLRQALDTGVWMARRVALATVAACAEVMPTALQQAAQGSLEALLVKGVVDMENCDSRRFAFIALSYLRTVTPAVVSALLIGSQDIPRIAQRDVTCSTSA